ncbi:MAG: outer membrane beta-barrel protein [Legionellales bacterium]|nr:outer membrane beta-barrel protein [Legionellales bacterium]
MKRTPLLLGLLCILQTPCFAIKPVDGTYASVIIGPTASQNITFTLNPAQIPSSTISNLQSTLQQVYGVTPSQISVTNENIPGTLSYDILGGVGGSIGYKYAKRWRAEGEFLYYNNPFTQLAVGSKILTTNSAEPLYIKGDTNFFLGAANFYYDLLIPSRDGYSALTPFAGLGLGYLYQENTLTFHSQTAEVKFKGSITGLAAQVILGANYYMDDFCWLSVDIRYLATPIDTRSFPNAGISYSERAQTLAVMFGFQGVL